MISGTASPQRFHPRHPPGPGEGSLILLYHRVAVLQSDPQLLSVTPQHFGEHLEILKRHFHPLGLHHVMDNAERNRVRSRSVVITFDDGYADNLDNARPLLEAADVPATVFVVAGHLDGQREFWWDELERILFETVGLPSRLSLSLSGEHDEWDVGESTAYTVEQQERHAPWNVLQIEDPTARHRLYRELFDRLRSLRHDRRQAALDRLLGWAGHDAMVRPTHRPLSVDQMIRLAGDGLIDIGAHTVTHSVLSALSIEDQRMEIAECRKLLEGALGRPVTTFSYPFGTRRDYTRETVTLVRELGFSIACSNYAGLVQGGTDRFQLPRFLVRDWDGDTFLRQLEEAWCAA